MDPEFLYQIRSSKIFQIFFFTVQIILLISPVIILSSLVFGFVLLAFISRKPSFKHATTKQERKLFKRQVNFSILLLIFLFCDFTLLMITVIVFKNEVNLLAGSIIMFIISAFVIVIICTILFSKHQQYSAKTNKKVLIIYDIIVLLFLVFSIFFGLRLVERTVELFNIIRGKFFFNEKGEAIESQR